MSNVVRLTPAITDEPSILCISYGLSRLQGRILYCLMISHTKSSADLAEWANTDENSVRNAVARIRDKLSPHKIAILSRYSVGYFMVPEDRRKVQTAVNIYQILAKDGAVQIEELAAFSK